MEKFKHFSLRVDAETLHKFHYIARSECHSSSAKVLRYIRRSVQIYEDKHGKIDAEDIKPAFLQKY